MEKTHKNYPDEHSVGLENAQGFELLRSWGTAIRQLWGSFEEKQIKIGVSLAIWKGDVWKTLPREKSQDTLETAENASKYVAELVKFD